MANPLNARLPARYFLLSTHLGRARSAAPSRKSFARPGVAVGRFPALLSRSERLGWRASGEHFQHRQTARAAGRQQANPEAKRAAAERQATSAALGPRGLHSCGQAPLGSSNRQRAVPACQRASGEQLCWQQRPLPQAAQLTAARPAPYRAVSSTGAPRSTGGASGCDPRRRGGKPGGGSLNTATSFKIPSTSLTLAAVLR